MRCFTYIKDLFAAPAKSRRFIVHRSAILFVALAACSAFSQSAKAALYLEDAFPYTTGNLNGQGGWSGGSGSQVAGGSLTYSGLQSPTVTSNKVSLPVTASTANRTFNGSAVSSGSVYLSFILKQTTLTTSATGGTVAGLDDDGAYTTGSGRVAAALGIHIKQTNTTRYLVGIRKGQGSSSAGGGTDIFHTGASFVANDVVFVVAKYTFGPSAGDDTVALWVNPATNSFGGSEPTASIANTDTGNTTDAASLQYVFVRCNSSTTSGANELDDLRVGSSWADVTPSSASTSSNSAPVAVADNFTRLPDFPLKIRKADLVTNDTDADNDALTIAAVNLTTTNGVSLTTNAGFIFYTNPQNVADRFTYTVSDPSGGSATGTVAITIANSATGAVQTVNVSGSSASPTFAGIPGYNYEVQRSINLTNWVAISTNIPPAGGLFSVTDNFSDLSGPPAQAFYRLRFFVVQVATLSIAAHPQSLTVTQGGNASFSVGAGGTAPFGYQWRKTGANIGSATNASLALTGVTSADAANYDVVVTNIVGSVTSSVAALTVLIPPSITTNPASLTVTQGNNATFTVGASGTPPLSYRWRKGGVNISNATNSSLTLASVTSSDAANYDVVVTNNAGSVTSAVATLTVLIPPTITTNPASLTVTQGQNATFTVSASGTAPLSYRWRKAGANIGNATNNSLTLTGVTSADAANYDVVVTNIAGSMTSSVATLTVLIPPTITTNPASLTVTQGQNATFTVGASGTAPLSYRWRKAGANIGNATNSSLALTGVTSSDAANYDVVVTNSAGSVTSSAATLTVLIPPTITTEPVGQTVLVSNNVTFSVIATGSPSLFYQWYFNTNTPLPGATNTSLTLTSVQTNQAGGYSVIVTNAYGSVTSLVATLTVDTSASGSPDFNLYGFGAPAAGGGMIPETDPNYRKVYNAGDLRLALANNNTKVIEIMNDLNLGWNEIGATNQTGAFRQSTAASLHPVLIASGVTTIDIQNKNGITIFSANGATLRHVEFNVKRTHNILIRNLKFDELWEWDEATKGDYDSKDWDFITIGDGDPCTNVWIDHCDFTKSYDGTVDIKKGANNVTISWCRFLADDGGTNSFVRRQFMHLETNGVSEAMFDFLRANGFSINDLVAVARSQKKGHLAGPTELDPENALIKLTLHHNYYYNHQDRLPRLRGGNAHVYNVYLNNTEARAAKLLRDAKVAAIPGGTGSYKFDVTLNGSISTEDGAVLVEKCHYIDLTSPLRNNQVSASNPTYTGKIRAEDTIYTLNGSTFRGDTEDPGSTLIPVPAPIIPFSWNGFASLPYSYPLDDPSALASLLSGNTAAGAGVLTWGKTNWMKTSY